jgi:hypothetical protein
MQVNVVTRVAQPANQITASPRKSDIPGTNDGPVLRGSRDHFIQSQFDYTSATPDAEYDLRFDADEEYVSELIDRVDGMSLRGVELCNATGTPKRLLGSGQGRLGKAQCADCERNRARRAAVSGQAH